MNRTLDQIAQDRTGFTTTWDNFFYRLNVPRKTSELLHKRTSELYDLHKRIRQHSDRLQSAAKNNQAASTVHPVAGTAVELQLMVHRRAAMIRGLRDITSVIVDMAGDDLFYPGSPCDRDRYEGDDAREQRRH